MQHITHFNKGLITKWLKGDYTTFNNYASWKSEVKAYKWEMFNINKTEGFSGYIHHEELIRNYYY